MPRPYSLIVAHDLDGAIGHEGGIPWHIPEDMRFFYRMTTQGEGTNAVIMGRRTYESLPKKPLRKRINMVVTSSPLEAPKDGEVYTASSLAHARELLEDIPGLEKVFVIGGARLLEEAIHDPECTTAIVTIVHASYPGDTFISIDALQEHFELTGSSEVLYDGETPFQFVICERKN